MTTLVRSAPFTPLQEGAVLGFNISKNAKKYESADFKESGMFSLGSQVFVTDAGDDEYATSIVRGSYLIVFEAPSDGPFAVVPEFLPFLGGFANGYIEDESGHSSVSVLSNLSLGGTVYSPVKGNLYMDLGEHETEGGTVYGIEPLISYVDKRFEDHNWFLPRYFATEPSRLHYPYFGDVPWQGRIQQGDVVFMDLQISWFNMVRANDVSLMSAVYFGGVLKKVTIDFP